MGKRPAFASCLTLLLMVLAADVDAAARKGRRRATRDFPVGSCPVHLGKSVDGETGLPIPDSPVRIREELRFVAQGERAVLSLAACDDATSLGGPEGSLQVTLDNLALVKRDFFESRQTLYDTARESFDCYQDGTNTFSKSVGSFFSEVAQCGGVSPDCPFLDNFDDTSASASRWELDAAQLEGGQLVLAREDRGGVCTEATVRLSGLVPRTQYVVDFDWEVGGVGFQNRDQPVMTAWTRTDDLVDFTGDLDADLLWHNQRTGDLYVWGLERTIARTGTYLTPSRFPDTRWQIRGINDLNGDGQVDILWHHQGTGDLYVWFLERTSPTGTYTRVSGGSYLTPSRFADTAWQIRAVADFDGDTRRDILWHHQKSGDLYVWFLDAVTPGGPHTAVKSGSYLTPSRFADTNWQIRAVADFGRGTLADPDAKGDADGRVDLLWHNLRTGDLYVWFMNGTVVEDASYLTPARFADTTWRIVATRDFDRDGQPDLLWQHQARGDLYVWFMDRTTVRAGSYFSPAGFSDLSWKVVPQ